MAQTQKVEVAVSGYLQLQSEIVILVGLVVVKSTYKSSGAAIFITIGKLHCH